MRYPRKGWNLRQKSQAFYNLISLVVCIRLLSLVRVSNSSLPSMGAELNSISGSLWVSSMGFLHKSKRLISDQPMNLLSLSKVLSHSHIHSGRQRPLVQTYGSAHSGRKISLLSLWQKQFSERSVPCVVGAVCQWKENQLCPVERS